MHHRAALARARAAVAEPLAGVCPSQQMFVVIVVVVVFRSLVGSIY